MNEWIIEGIDKMSLIPHIIMERYKWIPNSQWWFPEKKNQTNMQQKNRHALGSKLCAANWAKRRVKERANKSIQNMTKKLLVWLNKRSIVWVTCLNNNEEGKKNKLPFCPRSFERVWIPLQIAMYNVQLMNCSTEFPVYISLLKTVQGGPKWTNLVCASLPKSLANFRKWEYP